MTACDLRQAATDFAAQLAGFPAIVGVDEVARCAAVGTTTVGRQGASAGTLNRRQRSAVLALVLNHQLPPVQSAGGRRERLAAEGGAAAKILQGRLAANARIRCAH